MHTRHEWAPWDAFVYVEDPDSLAAEFRSRGVSFYKEIVDRVIVRGFEVRTTMGTYFSLVAR